MRVTFSKTKFFCLCSVKAKDFGLSQQYKLALVPASGPIYKINNSSNSFDMVSNRTVHM